MKKTLLGMSLIFGLGSQAFANSDSKCSDSCAAHCEAAKINCEGEAGACAQSDKQSQLIKQIDRSVRPTRADRF